MTFTIVVDSDLHFSIIELAAILDLELKSQDHHYKPLFQRLLNEKKHDELVQELADVQPLFVRKLSKKSFEPTVNLYLHITSLMGAESASGGAEGQRLLASLLSNIDPNSAANEETKIELPTDVLLLALTNLFNALPNTSIIKFESLVAVVTLVAKENISGLISKVADNIQEWVSSIEGITVDQTAQLVELVFVQYFAEDESKAFAFVESLVAQAKLSLNSGSYIRILSKVLSSSQIYNLTNLKPAFGSIADETFVKLLNFYLVGDYKGFTSSKSEFQAASFSNEIDFVSLESSLQALAVFNYIASSNSSTIAYNTISSEFSIPIEDVELQLTTLISQGLVVAKLSQATGSITVHSINYVAPSLSSNTELVNWNEINTLLASWEQNINNLQDVLQNLISKRGKKVVAPPVIIAFHQQKLEAKKARENKLQQAHSNENVPAENVEPAEAEDEEFEAYSEFEESDDEEFEVANKKENPAEEAAPVGA